MKADLSRLQGTFDHNLIIKLKFHFPLGKQTSMVQKRVSWLIFFDCQEAYVELGSDAVFLVEESDDGTPGFRWGSKNRMRVVCC